MNDSQKHSKVEMEILSHEKEMMRMAKIKKLNEGPLADKIKFIKAESDKKEWTPEEMLEELKTQGLYDGKTTVEDIKQLGY